MKKYLFGLGAMLIGAGLMFVFTHTEVRAENEISKPEEFVCSKGQQGDNYYLTHCETKTLDCAVVGSNGVTCVKKGMFK